MYTKMESERRERFCLSRPLLLGFIAVTFTVAMLEGVGFIVAWTHFEGEGNALDVRIRQVEDKLIEGFAAEDQPEGTEGTEGTEVTGRHCRHCHLFLPFAYLWV